MTILDIAEKFPPCVCRYLARKNHGHKPMTVRDIAEKSGLGKSTVAKLSLLRTWKGVSIDTVVSFSLACGVDLLNPHKVTEYLRRSKRAHLDNVSPIQRKFFHKLFTQRG